jgi:hypothetical protein
MDSGLDALHCPQGAQLRNDNEGAARQAHICATAQIQGIRSCPGIAQ